MYRLANFTVEREKRMTKSIDLKSFLIGGLLVLLVLCALGAMPRQAPPGAVGRYALVVSHIAGENNDYVIDTVTGQIWPRLVRGRLDTSFYAPKTGMRAPAEPNRPDPR